jgi:hypothetical protein
MTEKTVRRQSVSRRTLLSGTAGLLGGAALSSGPALAQNTAPASTAANSSYNPHYPDPAWLALRQEEIIEPGLEIVDPHHHLWDRPGNRFLLTELLADTSSGHNITHTVFVECGSHDYPQPRRRADRDRALQGEESRDLRSVEGRHR